MNLNIHAHAIRSKNVTTLHGRGSHPLIKLLIMKLIILLTVGFSLHVSANALGQHITLSVKEASFKNVLQSIQRQSGYSFIMARDLLEQAGPVTIDVRNEDINEVLPQLFEMQPFTYEVNGNLIKVIAKSYSSNPTLQQNIIRGQVTDTLGNPLEGVIVEVTETGRQAVTDRNGEFELDGVIPSQILNFRLLGYQSFQTRADRPIINAMLRIVYSELDETIVIAYGTTTKRLTTGNISKVKGADIARQPVNNPLLALQGNIPGIYLSSRNGLPGSNVKVRIQGTNSLANGNEPFYVIDGVPYLSQSIPAIATAHISEGISPLNFLNPSMIESIEILKDADATAIYGSRAANGAILITTKKGYDGPTRINFRVESGMGKISQKLKLLNTQQYLEIRRMAFNNDSKEPGSTDYDLNGTWDMDRYTDWQEELVGGTARYSDAMASISGGNSYTNFTLNAGYRKEGSVFPDDLADTKSSAQFNLSHQSNNGKFRVQLSVNFMNDNNELSRSDFYSTALSLPPNAPALYTPDGSLNWEVLPNGNSTWTNPLRSYESPYRNKTKNLISNAVIKYTILDGLEIASSFGLNQLRSKQRINTKIGYFSPTSRPNQQRISDISDTEYSGWLFEPTATYKRSFPWGTIEILLGGTFQESLNEQLRLDTRGYSSDELLDNTGSASTISVRTATINEYRYAAIFGRLNYNWNKKYILNINTRRDGSSRFGPESRFHTFYSIGGAWIFSEEEWLKNNISLLSFGKIRSSYGTTGNDQIGDYTYINLYNSYNVGVPYQGQVGLSPAGHFNPYLAWEKTSKFNLGIDLGFLNEKISFSTNYFVNQSSNQLVSTQLPNITGFNAIKTNLPATIRNTGIELVIATQQFDSKIFGWSTNVNFTKPNNKLISFPNLDENLYYNSVFAIGYPVEIFKGFIYSGINSTTGLFEYIGANGEPTSSPVSATDRNAIMDTSPKFYGGLQNTLRYKNLELNFLMQFVSQKAKDYLVGQFPGIMGNQPASIIEKIWRKEGDIAELPKVSTTILPGSLQSSSSNVEFTDASFIRLKNVSLAFELPEKWKSPLKIQNARLYCSGQNLFTFTKFTMDPETKNYTSLPTLRMLTFGIIAGF